MTPTPEGPIWIDMTDKTRRFRITPAKPGQLKVQWGKSDGFGMALLYLWGGYGASKSDVRMLSDAIERPQIERDYSQGGMLRPAIKEVPSLAQELEARGYDLSTLKITVDLKATP